MASLRLADEFDGAIRSLIGHGIGILISRARSSKSLRRQSRNMARAISSRAASRASVAAFPRGVMIALQRALRISWAGIDVLLKNTPGIFKRT